MTDKPELTAEVLNKLEAWCSKFEGMGGGAETWIDSRRTKPIRAAIAAARELYDLKNPGPMTPEQSEYLRERAQQMADNIRAHEQVGLLTAENEKLKAELAEAQEALTGDGSRNYAAICQLQAKNAELVKVLQDVINAIDDIDIIEGDEDHLSELDWGEGVQAISTAREVLTATKSDHGRGVTDDRTNLRPL